MAVGLLPRLHPCLARAPPGEVGIRLREFRRRSRALLEDAVEQGVADFAISLLPMRAWDGPLRTVISVGEEFVIVVPPRRSARRAQHEIRLERATPTGVGAVPPGSRARRHPRGRACRTAGSQPARLRAEVRRQKARRGSHRRASARRWCPTTSFASGHRGVGAALDAEADPRRRRVCARTRVVADGCRVHRRARIRASAPVRAVPSTSASDPRGTMSHGAPHYLTHDHSFPPCNLVAGGPLRRPHRSSAKTVQGIAAASKAHGERSGAPRFA